MSSNPVTITAPEGVPFIDIVREFDAPVEQVFRAHVDPDLVSKWLGPNGFQVIVDTYDARTGGSYRYVHKDPDGNEYGFNGVFHVVRPNEFIIQTFEFDGFPDVVSLEALTLEDLGGGRTRLSAHSTYPSMEARDGMLGSDMEQGLREGYQRLDALLAAS